MAGPIAKTRSDRHADSIDSTGIDGAARLFGDRPCQPLPAGRHCGGIHGMQTAASRSDYGGGHGDNADFTDGRTMTYSKQPYPLKSGGGKIDAKKRSIVFSTTLLIFFCQLAISGDVFFREGIQRSLDFGDRSRGQRIQMKVVTVCESG